MTKKELVELLKDVPDDAVVVIPGHSDSNGMNNISSVDRMEVSQYTDWSGEYHPWCSYYEKENFDKFVVFCIN